MASMNSHNRVMGVIEFSVNCIMGPIDAMMQTCGVACVALKISDYRQ